MSARLAPEHKLHIVDALQAVVHLPPVNLADTAPLPAGDWALCAAMASLVLWVDELKKLALNVKYRRTRRFRRT